MSENGNKQENPIVQPEITEKDEFEVFEDFIKTGSLDPKIAEDFKKYLRAFFEISKYDWFPGNCNQIPPYLNRATKLAEDVFGKPLKVKVRQWDQGRHYWLELIPDPGQQIVIDPTGVPLDKGQIALDDVMPFFGLISESNNFPNFVYTHGENFIPRTGANRLT